ncbi:MAG: hypothetical protein R3C97_14555 [Geminicoccaceae bacterium]
MSMSNAFLARAMYPESRLLQNAFMRVSRWGGQRLMAFCWALVVGQDPRHAMDGMPRGEVLAANQLPQIRPLVELFRHECRGDGHELARWLYPIAHEWFEGLRERLQRSSTDDGSGRLEWLERAELNAKKSPLFSLLRSVIVRIARPVQHRRTRSAEEPASTGEAEKTHGERRTPGTPGDRGTGPSPEPSAEDRQRRLRARGRGLLLRELAGFVAGRSVELAWHLVHRLSEAERAQKAEAAAATAAGSRDPSDPAGQASPPPAERPPPDG